MATPTRYVSGNYSNEDLINIFEPLYNSVGAPTGFVSGNYNKDLSDIFQFRLPFKFLSGSGNNYEGYYLSNGFYILEFYYDINAFTFVPTTNLEIHQLFLVGTGSDGSGGNGGNGGKIISYDGVPITINNNNLFTINVTTGDNDSTVTNISGNVLNLNTTNGTAASGGTDGIQNTYNSLYYGGGGGYGFTNSAGGNGGKGGGGGGGGGINSISGDGYSGGNGGGDGINSGGSGGVGGPNPNGSDSQFGGGGGAGRSGDMFNDGKGGNGGIDGGLDKGKGGAAGQTYGGGGGGGNRYGGGGGGSSGTNPGTGGTGCVLLIYKIIG